MPSFKQDNLGLRLMSEFLQYMGYDISLLTYPGTYCPLWSVNITICGFYLTLFHQKDKV